MMCNLTENEATTVMQSSKPDLIQEKSDQHKKIAERIWSELGEPLAIIDIGNN